MIKQKPAPEIKVGIEDIKTFIEEAELGRVRSEFFNRLFTIVIAWLGKLALRYGQQTCGK